MQGGSSYEWCNGVMMKLLHLQSGILNVIGTGDKRVSCWLLTLHDILPLVDGDIPRGCYLATPTKRSFRH